ncbi:hypothetical protein ACFUYE_24630 [Micromonospora humida]|uniref:hypothetical protein n=1 Tax=Micromonospora humida TaxID=2809018 RepID=UPI00366C0646
MTDQPRRRRRRNAMARSFFEEDVQIALELVQLTPRAFLVDQPGIREWDQIFNITRILLDLYRGIPLNEIQNEYIETIRANLDTIFWDIIDDKGDLRPAFRRKIGDALLRRALLPSEINYFVAKAQAQRRRAREGSRTVTIERVRQASIHATTKKIPDSTKTRLGRWLHWLRIRPPSIPQKPNFSLIDKVDEASIDMDFALNLLGPPPEGSRNPGQPLPRIPVGAS